MNKWVKYYMPPTGIWWLDLLLYVVLVGVPVGLWVLVAVS